MKKFLILIPFLMLAWCETATVQEQVVEEQQAEEQVVQETVEETPIQEDLYIGDDDSFFSLETPSWLVHMIPAMISEETELKSNNMFIEKAVAGEYSKFLVVWFAFINESKEQVVFSYFDILDIYDSEWRKYEVSPEYTSDFYLPTAINWLSVRPWIPWKWYVVYEVPRNATWFYMEAPWKKILMKEREISE